MDFAGDALASALDQAPRRQRTRGVKARAADQGLSSRALARQMVSDSPNHTADELASAKLVLLKDAWREP